MARKQLYINGTGTGAYGIYINSDTYLNAPEIDYTAHEVPGRSGDLLQWNKRLRNIIRKFECYIPEGSGADLDGFKKLIYSQSPSGYMTITSDYETDTYQRGYLAQEIAAEPFQADDKLSVTFELYFSCEPQKYFKQNGSLATTIIPFSAMRAPGIFPRSNVLVIQKMLQLLPPGDTPDADAFAIFPYSFSGTTALSVSIANYTGFVAIIAGGWLERQGRNEPGGRANRVLAYSKTGTIAEFEATPESFDYIGEGGGTYSKTEDYVAVIVPADAAGRVTFKAGTATLTWTLGSAFHIDKSEALGLSDDIRIIGEYGWGNYPLIPTSDPINTIYVVGTLNGEKTFSAAVSINTDPFIKFMAVNEEAVAARVKINSHTLDVIGIIKDTEVSLNEVTGVYGELEGMADRIDIYLYHSQNYGHPFQRYFFKSIGIEPKWWKV